VRGKRVGRLFTFGDEGAVLARSRSLILEPLSGHPEASRRVTNLNLRGTIKELVATGWRVRGESRWNLPFRVPLPRRRGRTSGRAVGLGSRSLAAANMSAGTKAVDIVVPESSVVRLFCHGRLVGEIIPESWMMDHTAMLRGSVKREQVGHLTILTLSRRPALAAK